MNIKLLVQVRKFNEIPMLRCLQKSFRAIYEFQLALEFQLVFIERETEREGL